MLHMKLFDQGNQTYITGILGELFVMFHVAQIRQVLPAYWRYKHRQFEIDLIYQISPNKLIFIEVRSVIVSCETGYSELDMARMMPWKKKSALIRACTGYVIRETGKLVPDFKIFCAFVALNDDLSPQSIQFHRVYENL